MKTLLLALLATPLAAATPFQAETIPADANWYLHADLTALRDTTAGSFLVKFVRKKQAVALAEIENIFELDPLADLTGLTLFGTGKKDEGALILRGKMDRNRFETVIVHADNHETSNHGARTLHHWDDKGKRQHAGFHDNSTLVIGPQENLVKLALEVLAGKKPGLPAKLKLPAANPTVVAFANIAKIEMPDDQGSRIVRKANSLTITLDEKDERLQAAMTAETDSPQTSRQILQIMEGLIALGQLADDNIAALGIEQKGQASGKTITMSMSLSTTKALEILSQMP